jgi:LacI family transcriptional regulator
MIRHGYTKIVLFEGRTPEKSKENITPECLQRTRGYETAMADHGLKKMPLPPLRNWDIDRNPVLIKEYIDQGVEAFVLMDDDGAATLLRVLSRLGIKVPDDVAVIGFDNDRICEFTDPPLSSVKMPVADMARCAVNLLSDRIKSGTQGNTRSIVLRPTVVARESCGNKCPLADASPKHENTEKSLRIKSRKVCLSINLIRLSLNQRPGYR